MRTELASAAAAALVVSAAAWAGPADREEGLSFEAYVGFNDMEVSDTAFNEGEAPVETASNVWGESFGAALVYRQSVAERLVVGAGVFLEGQSIDATVTDTTVVQEIEGEEIEVPFVEEVEFGTGYGVRGLIGVPLEGSPVMIYATGSWGRVDVSRNRFIGGSARRFEDTQSYWEAGIGAEVDFARSGAVYAEIVHRDYSEFETQYETPAAFGRLKADGLQLRAGVRLLFGQ